MKNNSLFDEDANPVIDSYLQKKEKLILSSDKLATNFFTCDTTKTRRQWKEVQGFEFFWFNFSEHFFLTYINFYNIYILYILFYL